MKQDEHVVARGLWPGVHVGGMSWHVAFGLACRATGDDDADMGMFGTVASCLASIGLGSNIEMDKQNLSMHDVATWQLAVAAVSANWCRGPCRDST